MALTNDKTITGVLTSAASYAPTIAGQTQRIADAHEIIQAKAIALGLNIQKGEGDAKPTSTTLLTDSHKIMDTASAINSIVLLNLGNQTPEHGDRVIIPVGYVSSSYTVASKGTHTSGKSDITAATVLTGKEGWTANGTKVAGTMPDMGAISANVAMNSSYTIPAGYHNGSGKVTGPSITVRNAKSLSSANGGLATDAQNATATITINRYKSADGGTGLIARSVTIPAGYYGTSITLTPKIVDNAGNEESILNYADLSISGDLTFDTDNKIFYPLDSKLDYYGNITLPKVAGTTNTDGTYKVTTAGWINTGTYGKAYGGLTDTSLVWKTSATENIAYTDKILNSKNSWIDITKGKISDTYLKVIVRDAKASLSASLSNNRTVTPEIKVVTGGNVTNTTASTTKPTSGYYMAVLTSAKTTTITATTSCTLTTSGWLETAPSNVTATASVGANTSSITYVPVTTGILTVGNPTKNPASGTTGNISSVTAGNYYVAVTTTTAGWIPSGTVYKDLGFGQGSHSIGNLRKNGNTAITSGSTTLVAANAYYIKCSTTKGYQEASDQYITIATGTPTKSGVDYGASAFTGSVTLSAGYYPNQTISLTDFAVTARDSLSVTRSGTIITAKTYFHERTAVSVAAVEGILRDSTVKTEESNSNISINDGIETTVTATKLDALTDDTTFYATGNGNFKRYFTSFKVEVADVITALQKI